MLTATYLFLVVAAVALSTCAPLWMAVTALVAALIVAFRHELWIPHTPVFKS